MTFKTLKYFLLIFVSIGCSNQPRRISKIFKEKGTIISTAIRKNSVFEDLDDPFQTGKDTMLLNTVMSRIYKFPEVLALDKRIKKTTKGMHGVSLTVRDKFEKDSSYYEFLVGDNSGPDRYVNIYTYLLEKNTRIIKVYNHNDGAIMKLEEWRKLRDKESK